MSKHIVILGYSGSIHVIRWARAMAERDYKITVVSLGGESIDGISTIILPVGSSRDIGYLVNLRKVKKIIRSLKPDLVHVHYAAGFGLWGGFSRFHPLVVSVWGADVIDFPSNYIKRTLIRRVLRRADAVTATSRFLAERTLSLLPEIAEKTAVIPFGVEIPSDFKSDSSPDSARLMYIKAHRKKYGPDILLKAMPLVAKVFPQVMLTMAGKGEMTPVLKNMVEDLGLKNNVSFSGFIDNRKIFDLLSEHDIMVMPSIMDSESFGVAVLEASAAGLPVIAGEVGGVPEVLIDGQTGRLVPAKDFRALAKAIIELLGDHQQRQDMGRAGREFVLSNYLWKDCVDNMVRLYEKLITGSER